MEPVPRLAPVRGLGAFDASMVVVGSIAGAGVFVVSGAVAQHVASPAAFLGVWIIGGLLALCGALCNGELGAMFPRGGGEYVYLSEAYGPSLGFLSGWTAFWVGFPGSIATMAVAFGRSVGDLAGRPPGVGDTIIATAAVVLLTVVNVWGLRPGKWAQNLLSLVKLLAFAALLVLGAFFGSGDTAHFEPFWGGGDTLGGLALALIPVSFGYLGWNAATYLAGEIRDPGRNLARALVWGTGSCILLYVALNAIYLYSMPIGEMRGVTDVAQVAVTRLFDASSATWLAVLVPVVILSSLQATVLVGPRIFQAMGEDGLFFRALGRLSPRSRVPVTALVVQGALSCALLWICELVWRGGFKQLLFYTTTAILVFASLTVIAVYVLRVRRPEAARPYRTPGYPLTPAVFVAGNLGVLGYVLVGGALEALIGLGIVLLGVPAYWWFRRAGRRP